MLSILNFIDCTLASDVLLFLACGHIRLIIYVTAFVIKSVCINHIDIVNAAGRLLTAGINSLFEGQSKNNNINNSQAPSCETKTNIAFLIVSFNLLPSF